MASIEQGPVSNRLVERVKNILFTPNTEWDVIEAEPATIQGIYRGYVGILAAIPAVAQFIASVVFYHFGVIGALVVAIVTYVGTLLGVYVTARIIDALAPSFGGQRNLMQAFKVAAYAPTAIWVVGVFAAAPPVSGLRIIGVYSFYLLYLGLPKLMKAPQDKAVVYTIVAIVVTAVVYAVVFAVAGMSVALAGLSVMPGFMR